MESRASTHRTNDARSGHTATWTWSPSATSRWAAGVFEPGWRWSEDVKPIAGTDSCQVHHTGICISGSMTVRYDDGGEMTIGPGDVVDLAPGHDAWTLGDEPCVILDTGVAAYASPR